MEFYFNDWGNMSGFTKLFSEIVTSSIWSEDDKTRIVWVTLLALVDNPKGYVPASIPGLANAARVSIEDCQKAVTRLESPDPYSRTKEHEGRRIEPVDGGWLILNYEKHRMRGFDDPRRVADRDRQRRHREKMSRDVRMSHVTTASASASASVSGKEGQGGKPYANEITRDMCRAAAECLGIPDSEIEAFYLHYAPVDFIDGAGRTINPKKLKHALQKWHANQASHGKGYHEPAPAPLIDYHDGKGPR